MAADVEGLDVGVLQRDAHDAVSVEVVGVHGLHDVLDIAALAHDDRAGDVLAGLTLTDEPPAREPPSGQQSGRAQGQGDEQLHAQPLRLQQDEPDREDSERHPGGVADAAILRRAVADGLRGPRLEQREGQEPDRDGQQEHATELPRCVEDVDLRDRDDLDPGGEARRQEHDGGVDESDPLAVAALPPQAPLDGRCDPRRDDRAWKRIGQSRRGDRTAESVIGERRHRSRHRSHGTTSTHCCMRFPRMHLPQDRRIPTADAPVHPRLLPISEETCRKPQPRT
ncbi:hypothetical protein [Microbacterium ulmi]|uniref:hypothetical protein n=1 Tax=Microbacterium ulmi TaxID=179095 RepID=UPI00201E3FBC|nr:hypothetical protein [Microbacterium ulmi]